MTRPIARDCAIDLLRGIAILLVLVLHFNLAYRLNDGLFAALFSARVMDALVWNGNYGVTIFFAISGFLITSRSLSRYQRLQNVSFRDFYAFRFARIAPTLALILVIVVALSAAGVAIFANKPSSVSMPLTVLSIVTFTHNWLMEKFGYFNYCLNVLWSLSVEEMFYFTFPIVCVVLRKDALIVALWTAVAIFAPIQRSHYAQNEIVALYGYWSCFDGIAIGCIAAVLKPHLRISDILRRLSVCLAAAGMAFIYFYKGIMDNVVHGVSAMALCTGIILLVHKDSASVSRFSRNFVARPLRWLGSKSYELYLFHVVVLAIMRTFVNRANLGYYAKPLWFALFLAISALTAGCVSRFYSEPLNIFIRKHLSRPRATQHAPIDAAVFTPST
jgi:peptidoglycan/LPS O-acetylase OafA/YrhL